ncbi:SGNH/GDSL hydrolase family protein [Nocardioides sp. 503]|uniref:SGNH/GDSL hydrolase family protein n=1 Tax=Nocardioides sp. 503 TaxID=2508326 RepID=UPI00106F978A|nr:SGNH/GDSL hydrolase family protein [Nocardioides sp. 503]
MPFPAGITTRLVTLGPGTTMEAGDALGVKATVKSSRDLVWAATGTAVRSVEKTYENEAGLELEFPLPVTDQAGWLLNGAIVDVTEGKQSHYYIIGLEFYAEGVSRPVSTATLGPFSIPEGDGSPIDADKLIPATTQGGATISLPDSWSEAVALAQAAAVEAAAKLVDSEVFVRTTVATDIPDPESEVGQAFGEAGRARFAAPVRAFESLKASLTAATRSTAIQVLSDSTAADASIKWVYRFAQLLMVMFPAWTFHYRLWDDANQRYGPTTVMQTGTAGVRYLDCSTGTTTRRLDPLVSPHLAGTIDVQIKVSMADWTPGAQTIMAGRSGAGGTRGWYVLVNTAGLMTFVYSVDGTALATVSPGAVLGLTDGSTKWLRWVFTPNDGSGNKVLKCYTSDDGVTWTQVGTTQTSAGTVTLFNPNVGYEVGGVAAGIGNAGLKVYEIRIRDGEDGPNIVPALPDLWPPYNISSAIVVGAPICTIVNGSRSGANIAYLNDSVRLPKMTPDYGQAVTILSSSHNEGLAQGVLWSNLLTGWLAAVKARLPLAPPVLLTQNPETPAVTNWAAEHARRRTDTLAYARINQVDAIDTYKAFLDYGDWAADLKADVTHPNAAGYDLWRDVVVAAFKAI